MLTIKLDPRLAAVASLVTPGNAVADIGTDHAYLPAFLVQNGVCPRAVASDLRPGPLENAAATIRACALEETITPVLSDGLDALSPAVCDTVVLAGMGGLLITELLSRTPWVFSEKKQIVAQPMSHAEDVRRFFYERGFSLDREICAADGRHCYCAMAAHFTGDPIAVSPALPYVGTLARQTDPAAKRFLSAQYRRLHKRFTALQHANAAPEEAAALAAILDDFEFLVPGIADTLL